MEGIDINTQGGPDRNTPLHLAALGSYTSNYKIVNLLIDQGANLFMYNINLKTPFSVVSNNLLMIKILKKATMKEIAELYFKKEFVKESHLKNMQLF